MAEKIISDELLDHYFYARDYTKSELEMLKETAEDLYRSLTSGKSPRPLQEKGELVNVVGPPGAGKTTLLYQSLITEKRKRHSILFDPDIIRSQLPFFQKAMAENLSQGLSVKDADWKTFQQWNPASIFINQSLVNRAQEDGYNLMRCGTMGGYVTTDICRRTQKANFDLYTIVVLAPLSVCRKGIDQRIKTGGHPIQDDYIENAFQGITAAIPQLVAHSQKLQFFWRSNSSDAAHLVVEITEKGSCNIHDPLGVAEISETLGVSLESFKTWKNPTRPSRVLCHAQAKTAKHPQ